jgi:hypothetical protein
MELQQLLRMLQGVSGPNSSGEYTARCPAHRDKTASMTVTEKVSNKDGKRRLFICCHAGCGNDAIMAALGITARDLIVDPDSRGLSGRPRTPSASRKKGTGGKASGNQQNGETVDPETGEVIQGITVHTVGEDRGLSDRPRTPSARDI